MENERKREISPALVKFEPMSSGANVNALPLKPHRKENGEPALVKFEPMSSGANVNALPLKSHAKGKGSFCERT